MLKNIGKPLLVVYSLQIADTILRMVSHYAKVDDTNMDIPMSLHYMLRRLLIVSVWNFFGNTASIMLMINQLFYYLPTGIRNNGFVCYGDDESSTFTVLFTMCILWSTIYCADVLHFWYYL